MPSKGKTAQAMTSHTQSKLARAKTRRPSSFVSRYRPRTVLPPTGRGRWSDIAPFVGVSRETWRQLVKAGRAPTPLRLTERCTLYDFAAVHAWIADPASYQTTPAQ